MTRCSCHGTACETHMTDASAFGPRGSVLLPQHTALMRASSIRAQQEAIVLYMRARTHPAWLRASILSYPSTASSKRDRRGIPLVHSAASAASGRWGRSKHQLFKGDGGVSLPSYTLLDAVLVYLTFITSIRSINGRGDEDRSAAGEQDG